MRSPETKMQIALMRWWATEYRELNCPSPNLLFHVPNGGRREKRTGAIFKAMGLRAGIPDLILAWPMHGYHALAMELKTARGCASYAQETIRGLLIAESGWWVEQVRSLEGAKILLTEYFDPTSGYFREARPNG